MHTVALLLAGGTGTRLYPASRSHRPKQFLAVGGERSLLRRAADRASFADELYAITRERYADRVRGTVPEAGLLVEPASKDTGPALVYAAHRVREQVGDCTLVCLPSDHHVPDDAAFGAAARRAARAAAETDGLVTVGIEPDRPATGYGYVEPGEETPGGYAPVRRFTEKPDAETARELLDRGCYWNAGTFAWRPDALLREARDSPLAPLVDALAAGDPERGFAAVEPTSVDYAVMERTDDAYVVPGAFDWDDVGAWDALGRILDADGDGNAVLGDALTLDAADNVVAGDAHVTLIGVEELIVAAYDDRVLVAPVEDAQRVREAVRELDREGRF